MPITIPPELLARHPDWGGGSPAPTGNLGTLPMPQTPLPTPMPTGVNAPPSTSLGTLPVSTSLNTPYPAIAPTQNYGSPEIAQWQAQQNLLAAGQRQLGAERAVTELGSSIRSAAGAELDARSENVSANRALIAEQTRALEARRTAQERITAAKNDTFDILNTSRAQRERQTTDYRYQLAGLPTPIEVKLPEGHTGPLPAGIRKRIETLAEILTDKEVDAEKMRQFNIEAARIHEANTGLKVTEAAIASGRVRLTLDEAEEAARLAGFDVRQAQLGLTAATQAPLPGLVWDEVTGTWATRSVAALNQALESQRISQIVRERTGQDAGTYGAISVDTLVSAYVIEAISEDELRQGLLENGESPSTVEVYVRIAKQRLNERKKSASILTDEERAALGLGPAAGGPTSSRTGTPTTGGIYNSPAYSDYLTGQEREDIR